MFLLLNVEIEKEGINLIVQNFRSCDDIKATDQTSMGKDKKFHDRRNECLDLQTKYFFSFFKVNFRKTVFPQSKITNCSKNGNLIS